MRPPHPSKSRKPTQCLVAPTRQNPDLILPTPDPDRLQCRHILTGGRRCGSPCLRNEDFCYYHHTTRKPSTKPGFTPRKHSVLDLPRPEDRSAVQHSIGEVLRMIAADEIDPRRAGLLLYGLQIASHNLPRPDTRTDDPLHMVEDVTEDPEGGLLAPRGPFQAAPREKTLEEILLEQFAKDKVDNQVPPPEYFSQFQGEGGPTTIAPKSTGEPEPLEAIVLSSCD